MIIRIQGAKRNLDLRRELNALHVPGFSAHGLVNRLRRDIEIRSSMNSSMDGQTSVFRRSVSASSEAFVKLCVKGSTDAKAYSTMQAFQRNSPSQSTQAKIQHHTPCQNSDFQNKSTQHNNTVRHLFGWAT